MILEREVNGSRLFAVGGHAFLALPESNLARHKFPMNNSAPLVRDFLSKYSKASPNGSEAE